MNKEIVDMIEAEAAQYAKEIWNSQEPPQDFIQTRKGKRSYEDYIAGRSKNIEVEDALRELVRLKDIKDNLDLCLDKSDGVYLGKLASYKIQKEQAWQKAKQLLTKKI